MRIGVDIGGTFTDLVLIRKDGSQWTTKLLSTPNDPSIAFLQAVDRVLAEGVKPVDITELVHATTVATNAILESNTARVGLITTAGFRDVLEIGRHFRRDLYNLFLEKPPPLAVRELRLEVAERLNSRGEVIQPLDEAGVRKAARQLVGAGAEVIAIGFLHSYANPSHELAAAELVRQETDLAVITSHSVCAEYREYERFSTAVVHGAVMPTVRQYLMRVEEGLRRRKISAPLSIMQSNGGMASVEAIRRQPGLIIESGPAAGAISAIEVGRRLDCPHLIAFDMGGTTAKATLIRNGNATLSTDYEVGGGIQGGFGTGYPLRTPVIDLVEIGTGGGSIAWIDDAGHLHVGPKSAGADPGPACYGRGGTLPTITDANLILGRLRADHFAGGQFALHLKAAEDAVNLHIARPLGISITDAAAGIVAIANAQMTRALQLISVERGEDPREFAMVAFGGGGPMHAAELAMEVGCSRVIIPPEAGVQSAWGVLVADARRDYSQTFQSKTGDAINLRQLQEDHARLLDRGISELAASGFSPDAIVHGMAIDVRYTGQAYELTIELPAGARPGEGLEADIANRFHAEHLRLYGHCDESAFIQYVALRVRVIGQAPAVVRRILAEAATPLEMRQLGWQAMIWQKQCVNAPVYERGSLAPGDHIIGPALITQQDSSTAVPPGVSVSVATTGDLVLTFDREAHANH